MGLPSSVRKTERWSHFYGFCISMILFYFEWWSCCFAICALSGQTKAGANISKSVAPQRLASATSLQVKVKELAVLPHWCLLKNLLKILKWGKTPELELVLCLCDWKPVGVRFKSPVWKRCCSKTGNKWDGALLCTVGML